MSTPSLRGATENGPAKPVGRALLLSCLLLVAGELLQAWSAEVDAAPGQGAETGSPSQVGRARLRWRVSTFAGAAHQTAAVDKVGGDARFSFPSGLTFGPDECLYVAEVFNHTVRRISADRCVSTVAGNARDPGFRDGPTTDARFNGPVGVAVTAGGQILVADMNNCAVRQITPLGDVTTVLDWRPLPEQADEAPATGSKPYGLLACRSGPTFYVTTSLGAIWHVDPGVAVRTVFRERPRPVGPWAMAEGPDGAIYISDRQGSVVWRVRDNVKEVVAGKVSARGHRDGRGARARFTSPAGIAVDPLGVVYVADAGDHTVRMITPDGAVSTLAGQPYQQGYRDGRPSRARFNTPIAVAVNRKGELFVADRGNHVIRMIRREAAR